MNDIYIIKIGSIDYVEEEGGPIAVQTIFPL